MTKSGYLTLWFRKPYKQLRIYKIITMIWEFFRMTSDRVKATAKNVKTKFLVLISCPEPGAPEQCPIQKNRIASSSGCALNVGRWYRLTSGHAPFFSLFTFFGDRD
jgi:hypothetical protein